MQETGKEVLKRELLEKNVCEERKNIYEGEY